MTSMTLLLSLASITSTTAAVDFDRQVVPILTKAGCNSGACHGAAVGRGGFRLSLYGGDPAFDYRSITREVHGRRINIAQPEDSLLLQKASEFLEHGGGYRLEYDGPAAQLLVDWIAAGAPRIDSPTLQQFTVSPAQFRADAVGAKLQLTATATFADRQEDVTRWTVFTPEDPASIEVDSETGVAKVLRPGRHIVVARYLDRVIASEILVPLTDEPIDLSSEVRENFIDEHVLGLLQTLRLPVSPPADDATFIRRVTLDLTGRLPAAARVQQYTANDDAAKRQQLVDELLASNEFNEYWTLQLAKLLRIHAQPSDKLGAKTYHDWLRAHVAADTPYDELARELLLATGDSHEVGAANFYRTVSGPREQAEFTSELLMGTRLRCANCHNHPLDRWTQDDYHGLAAIFAKVQQGRVVSPNPRGKVNHPRTGEPATLRIPGEQFIDANVDGRQALASWLTATDNPYFAKAIVNRLWKAMMGRGLVEPTDDLRSTNPATHPSLLAELAADFAEHGYSLRHTLRRIALSRAYGRSAIAVAGNAVDDRYYSRAIVRPLSPEVLADAISDVTGVPDTYGESPLGTRAVTLFDPQTPSVALDILGRCSREESCEAMPYAAGGLTTKLHLFNGELLNRRVDRRQGRLGDWLADQQDPEVIVQNFYLHALSRLPRPRELSFWSDQLRKGESSEAVLEDFLWGLLSCREFTTIH